MQRWIALALVLCLLNCSPRIERATERGAPLPARLQPSRGTAQLNLYAIGKSKPDIPIEWGIRKITLKSSDGKVVELSGLPADLAFGNGAPLGQIMTTTEVEPGQYTGLTIFTDYVRSRGKEIPTSSNLKRLSYDFELIAGNAKTLTIIVEPILSMQDENPIFDPLLSVEDQNPRPTGHLIYVCNELSSNVSVIDQRSLKVVYNVFVGMRPSALGADERRNRLYIADRKAGAIYEMDMITHHLLNATQIDYVDEPVHIEPLPPKDMFIVVNFGTDTIYLVDSFTLQTLSTIEVGDGPVDAAYSPAWDLTFVLNKLDGTVSVINLESLPTEPDTTLQVELEPSGIAIDDAMGWVYVSNEGSTDISVIRIETMAIEKTITVGTGAKDVAFDPFGRRVFIAMGYAREVTCVDPYTGVTLYSIECPGEPEKLLFDPNSKKLYVTLPRANAIAIIDPMSRSIDNVVETGLKPASLAVRL